MKRVLLMMLVLFGTLAMSQELDQAQAGSRASPLSAAPVSATATPPASQCGQDVNATGVGDVADIPSTSLRQAQDDSSGQREATAAEMDCQVYLPLVTTQPPPPDRQIRRLKRRNRVDVAALGLDLTIQAEQAEQ